MQFQIEFALFAKQIIRLFTTLISWLLGNTKLIFCDAASTDESHNDEQLVAIKAFVQFL